MSTKIDWLSLELFKWGMIWRPMTAERLCSSSQSSRRYQNVSMWEKCRQLTLQLPFFPLWAVVRVEHGCRAERSRAIIRRPMAAWERARGCDTGADKPRRPHLLDVNCISLVTSNRSVALRLVRHENQATFDGYISDALSSLCAPAPFIAALFSPCVNLSAPHPRPASEPPIPPRPPGRWPFSGTEIVNRETEAAYWNQLAEGSLPNQESNSFAALFNLDRLRELRGSGIFTDPGGQNLCTAS